MTRGRTMWKNGWFAANTNITAMTTSSTVVITRSRRCRGVSAKRLAELVGVGTVTLSPPHLVTLSSAQAVPPNQRASQAVPQGADAARRPAGMPEDVGARHQDRRAGGHDLRRVLRPDAPVHLELDRPA